MPPRLRPVLAVALGLGLTLGLVPSAGAAAPAPIDPTTGERPTDRGPFAVAADPQPSESDGYAPGHVLVRFADSTTSSQQRSALSSVGGSREGTIAGTGFVEVAVGDDDPQTVADALADDPRVAEVQVDHVRHATAWTNDPLLSYTWPYTDLTRMPRAWDVSTGSGIVVAVLDTGVSATHEDLTGSVLPGIDLVDGDSDATDEHGHGTLVAGIVAAHGNNGKGIAGTAYGAKILPVRVLDETGNGNDETIAEGISWAVAHGADVINLSLGGPEVAPLLRSAIASAVAAGVVVVAAAGNDGTETPFFPAAYAPDIDGLLAVGATDDDGALTSFSSWGDWVSLTAPGWSIVGPALAGGYASGSGTSFAAPQVSGTAALVLAHAPTRTPAQVEAALVSTARDAGPRGVDDYYGSGVLDAAAAVTVNDPVRAAVSVPLDRAASDPGGGDDSAARARAMTGGWADGTLAPEGDVDWYRAPVPAAGWYDVRVDLPYADEDQELDPVLEVRDAQGQVIGRADDAGTNVSEHVVVPAAAAGALLVGVTNGTGHASSQPYEVSVTLADQQVRFAEAAQTGAADTRTMAVGDVTGDGVVDVVTTSPGASFAVYPGDGDGAGSLAPPEEVAVTTATGNGIATADVDGDHDLDVVVAVRTGYQLFLQDAGSLTPGAVIPTTSTTGGSLLVAADMDGDGDTDLVLTGFADDSTHVAVNNGAGVFTLGVAVPTGLVRLTVGDATGDGHPDIVTASDVFAQAAGGTFAGPAALPYLATTNGVAVGDVTGDGRPDVVRTDGTGWLYVEPKLTTAGFGTQRKVWAGSNASPVALGDIDGDGRTDALVANQGWSTVSLLRQLPDGTFDTPEVVAPLTSQPWFQEGAFRLADLDGDGLLDVVQTPNGVYADHTVVVLHHLSLTPVGAEHGWFDDVTPTPHSSGAALRPTVKVVAGRPLSPASLTAQTVRLRDGQTGATVSTVRAYDAATRTLSITPTADLSPGGHYEVIVRGVTDADGFVQDTPLRTWFTVAAHGDRFTPMDPLRVLDTRIALGVPTAARVASGQPVRLDLSDDVPAGTTAVVLNVTASAPSTQGNIRVYPTPSGSGGAPKVSNLNVMPGVDQPNLVTVGLGADGSVTLLAEATTTHLIADLAGYYSPGGGTAFEPVAPVRLLDLRDGTGGVPAGRLQPGHWVDLQVAGKGGVPADASAVVLNVTGTGVTGLTHVRVYPSPGAGEDQTPPDISNLNLSPGRDQPNLVTVRLGDGGRVRFYIHTAAAYLLADLAGYYTATGDNGFVPLTPTRIADTRSSLGIPLLRSGVASPLKVGGVSGVPSTATAAVLNITGSQPRGVTHVRAFPTTVPATLPDISTINLVPGRDEANLAIVRLGDSGRVSFYAATADVDLIVDVSGYFRK